MSDPFTNNTTYMMPGSLVRDEQFPKSLGLVTAAKPGERKVTWIKDGKGRNFNEYFPHSAQGWIYMDLLVEVKKDEG